VTNRPDPPALLDAIARFLLEEVQPQVSDRRLSFRLLIAANLATTVAAELRSGEDRALGELRRWQDLLPGVESGDAAGMSSAERARATRALEAEFLSRLRSGRLSRDEVRKARAHVRQSLVESLRWLNPHFDTSEEIE